MYLASKLVEVSTDFFLCMSSSQGYKAFVAACNCFSCKNELLPSKLWFQPSIDSQFSIMFVFPCVSVIFSSVTHIVKA